MIESYILAGVAIALPGGIIDGGTLVVSDGRVRYAGPLSVSELCQRDPFFRSLPAVRLDGSMAVPALFEFHIHGAFGIGFESLEGPKDLRKLAEKLRGIGVGRFMPTILWREEPVTRLVDAIMESGLYGTAIPGIYLEGPFVNPAKRGGIGMEAISAPDPKLLERILRVTRGTLRLMTVAPELEGISGLYPLLAKAGVRISLGHSAAPASAATPSGPFSVTHLFNAMSGLDHRGEGGLANLALAGAARWVELNADGVHVNCSSMRVASRCLREDQLLLTSDAVVAAGLGTGEFRYFDSAVVSDGHGVRYRDSGTLIGSASLGMDIVKSFAACTGTPLHAAIASMTRIPCEAIGADPAELGCVIQAGAKADLFVWNRDLSSCVEVSEILPGSDGKETP